MKSIMEAVCLKEKIFLLLLKKGLVCLLFFSEVIRKSGREL